MSTHPVCIKCNVHYAVYGSDYCNVHGGVVPKTIAEYEAIKQRLEVEAKSDTLESKDWSNWAESVQPATSEFDSVSRIALFEHLQNKAAWVANLMPEDAMEASYYTGSVDAYNSVIDYLTGT